MTKISSAKNINVTYWIAAVIKKCHQGIKTGVIADNHLLSSNFNIDYIALLN